MLSRHAQCGSERKELDFHKICKSVNNYSDWFRDRGSEEKTGAEDVEGQRSEVQEINSDGDGSDEGGWIYRSNDGAGGLEAEQRGGLWIRRRRRKRRKKM